jgi:hypothetical protein
MQTPGCGLLARWNHRTGLLLGIAILLGNTAVHAGDGALAPIYSCTFQSGGWQRADWLRVKNPMGEHFGDWVEQPDCITNEVPAGTTADSYSSMVYKEKVKGNVTITSTMAFACEMAPLIVLAPELPENAKGQKEYREHFEVVIYNRGVNVWRYFVKDGKLLFRKAAFANFRLEKDVKYLLTVTKTDKTLTVSVGGHTFGYFDDGLPETCYVGITGCEGLNRFYDFAVRR